MQESTAHWQILRRLSEARALRALSKEALLSLECEDIKEASWTDCHVLGVKIRSEIKKHLQQHQTQDA